MGNKNKNTKQGGKGRIEKGSKSVAPISIPKPSPPPKQPNKND